MHRRVSASKASLLKSFGAWIQMLAFVFLVGLIPYTLYAGWGLYVALSSMPGVSIGPLVYPAARLTSCLLLFYALWRVRQAGMRLRDGNPPGR
jgi:hypothetical protein